MIDGHVYYTNRLINYMVNTAGHQHCQGPLVQDDRFHEPRGGYLRKSHKGMHSHPTGRELTSLSLRMRSAFRCGSIQVKVF